MTSIKDRFQQIADYKKVSIRKLEQLFSLNRGNISNISDKNGAIGSDKLSKICENMPEISIEWLLTGKGEMLKDSGSVISQTIKGNGNISNAGNNRINIPIQTTSQELSEDKELLKELRNIIKDKDKIIADKDRTIAELREELKEKREELKELKEELKEVKTELKEIKEN